MRLRYVLFVLATFLMVNTKTMALSTCSMERTKELTSLAQNVNVDYEEYKNERGKETYPDLDEGEIVTEPGFAIRIYNIPEDLNVKIKRNGMKEEKELYKSDANENGILVYDTGFPDVVKNYTITVRSDDSNCQNEVLRKISITIPALNYYYDYEICKANPEYYLCQEYVSVDLKSMTTDKFMKQVEEYVQQKEKKEEEESKLGYKLMAFIKRYAGLFITIIILGVGIFVVIRIRNKQRSKMI